jgi:cytoskeletal protein RodZ
MRNHSTLYDILDIEPNASQEEVRQAYKEAKDFYSPDSIGTYSLFSPDERKTILEQIEKAYHILTNSDERKSYDTVLEKDRSTKSTKPSRSTNKPKLELVPQEGEAVDGRFLRNLRESLGYDIEELGDRTKVHPRYLRLIEDDDFAQLPPRVYVQGYVRLYLKHLHPDAENLVRLYMKYYDQQNAEKE